MTTATLIAAIFSLCLTLLVLWANPRRFSNQVFAFLTLVESLWLACVYRAKQAGLLEAPQRLVELESWQRANAAVIAFFPAAIWLLHNAIIHDQDRKKSFALSLPVILLSIILVLLCYSPSFTHPDANNILQRGTSYYLYIAIAISAYLICLYKILRQMHARTGIQKVELQFLALNAGGVGVIAGTLNAFGNLLHVRTLNAISVLIVLLATTFTALALIFHRVFRTQEVLIHVAQRALFTSALCTSVYCIWLFANAQIPAPFGILISIAACGTIAIWMDDALRGWFENRSKGDIASMRQAIINMASHEPSPDKILVCFEQFLAKVAQCRSVSLWTTESSPLAGFIVRGTPAHQALCEMGWATPESLQRRRSTEVTLALSSVIKEHSLALILTSPRNSSSPSLIATFGTRTDGTPFTYPEIVRLANLTELMDNILKSTRLSLQTAIQAQIEHLALMSRELAHDLKNLITPVSSFLIHTDGYFPSGSIEAEVHSSARRSMQAMTDYVREALFFAEKLEPRFAPANLTDIFEAVKAVTRDRASQHGIELIGVLDFRDPVSCDGVLIQRLLANLVSNSIDASSRGKAVTFSATKGERGGLRLTVADQGCGIRPENLARVFEPYFTTKGFGDGARGFGLGLTICQKIVLLHYGQISVQSEFGRGTTITVELPTCQQPPPPAFRES